MRRSSNGPSASPDERPTPARGLDITDAQPRLLYAGGVPRTIDSETLAAAARSVPTNGLPLQIGLFGTGDRLERARELADRDGVMFVGGWVGRAEIAAAAAASAAGLVPYHPTPDFLMGMPNKVAEYLAFGLPVITSLHDGPVRRLCEGQEAGFLYTFGDATSLSRAMSSAVARWEARGRAAEARLQQLQRDTLDAARSTSSLADCLMSLASP
ncbi:MAG: glycosyltransferase [Deltaproteobacteria bacterium]|nr:glycosyltransferase [Deltaproteobacteria bacterium]